MLPGMNPRDLQKAMQRMGIKQTEIEATEVVIRTPTKDLIIENPQVLKVDMMGQESLQITGKIKEAPRKLELEISEDDIQTVSSQAKVSKEKAKKALEETKGDIAEAILLLQK